MMFMMTLSVFATVVVLNLASRSVEPIPKWMAWLVLNKMSHIVFLRGFVRLAQKDIKSNASQSGKEVYEDISVQSPNAGLKDGGDNNLNSLNMTDDSGGNDKQGAFDEGWKLMALVMTRFFALIFCTIVAISTVTILLYIWFQSKVEFENALGYLKDEWQKDTFLTDI